MPPSNSKQKIGPRRSSARSLSQNTESEYLRYQRTPAVSGIYRIIAQYNVVGLVQTKTVDSDTIHLLGYTVFTKNQRKLHVAKVWSEGITVAGKDALKKINILDDIPRKRKFTLYEGQSKYEDFCYSYVIKRHIITKIKYTYLRNCF